MANPSWAKAKRAKRRNVKVDIMEECEDGAMTDQGAAPLLKRRATDSISTKKKRTGNEGRRGEGALLYNGGRFTEAPSFCLSC